jgi:hypothetical protein
MSSLVKGDTIWNRKADSLIKPYNPFAGIGQKPKGYLTLSNGYYDEDFINDTLRRMGSVMFNTVTGKVEDFVKLADIQYADDIERPQEPTRFLSLDPMATKSPHMSPYSYANDNPIFMLDDGGDSTLFYSDQGQFLYSTNDKLGNAVVFVSSAADVINKFNKDAKFIQDNGLNTDNLSAQVLRQEGTVYLINPVKQFWNAHKDDYIVINGKKSAYRNEHGTYLNKVGNTIVPDGSDIKGHVETVTVNQQKNNGTIHTHPNEGLPEINEKTGQLGDKMYGYGPSDEDLSRKNINIIASPDFIYFNLGASDASKGFLIIIDAHKFGVNDYQQSHSTAPTITNKT